MSAPGFLWKDESTPANGPALALSPGCQLFSKSGAGAGAAEPTPGHAGDLSAWCIDGELEVLPKPPDDGLGLRLLAPGLPVVLAELGRDAVLSGVGLHVDSLDSSSSDEARASPGFLDVTLAFPVFPPPFALAARSCLRNFARRFWNHTCTNTRKKQDTLFIYFCLYNKFSS